jgi:hypothetical protein
MKIDAEPGIVWTEHQAFAKGLAHCTSSKMTKLWKIAPHHKPGSVDDFIPGQASYFGAGDSSILTTDEPAIIASIAAHSEGKNLERYSRNLVVAPMTSGKAWEQLLARTHRHGQQADEVVCEVFLHIPELRDSFEQARSDARYLEDTYGNRQKLNYADIVV